MGKKKSRSSWNKSISLFALFIPLILVVGIFIFYPKSAPFVSDMGEIDDEKLSYDFETDAIEGEFEGKLVQVPPADMYLSQVLGDSANTYTSKRIEIDLSGQKVYAIENDTKVNEFVVSTGKWAPTPKGEFTIGKKVRAQKMSGGDKKKNTYYYLPNVPWVMFFGNSQIPWSRGFSFHGAYWHNNFGQPMSHGCINMKIADSKTLYFWASEGTPVKIY